MDFERTLGPLIKVLLVLGVLFVVALIVVAFLLGRWTK